MSVPANGVLAAVESGVARADGYQEADEATKKLIQKWHDRVELGRKHDSKQREIWERDRKIAAGEPVPSLDGETEEWLVDTNLIGAIIEILLAFLIARDPDVSVKPSKAVGKGRPEHWMLLAETIEIVTSRLLRDARLKALARQWLRGVMTVGPGWLKATIMVEEPKAIMPTPLNDLQEQVSRAAVLRAEIADEGADADDPRHAEVDANMVAAQASLERAIAQGAAIDVMDPEDVVVSPECAKVENYLASPWIANDIYLTRERALEMLGTDDMECLKGVSLYMQRVRTADGEQATTAGGWSPVAAADTDGSAENPEGFLRGVEVWSQRDGTVYTFLEGLKTRWLVPPYPPRTSKRFYPLFLLGAHFMDGRRWPQSDTHQLRKLQEEYSRTRTQQAEHRRRAVPKTLFDAGVIDDKAIKAIAAAVSNEYVPVDRANADKVPLRDCFHNLQYPMVDPGLYSTQEVRSDMEKVSGAQEAMQASVTVQKTATEAKIEDKGFGARTGQRRDVLEEVIGEVATHIAQIALQVMEPADVIKYAGPEAVWVKLSAEEAFTMFDIEIKAGTTGKPKANSDREAWGTLMPLIQAIIGTIGSARLQGQEWAAAPLIELLRETFKRFDEPVDIERFIPKPPPPAPVVDPATGLPMNPAIAGAAPPADPAAAAGAPPVVA